MNIRRAISAALLTVTLTGAITGVSVLTAESASARIR